MIQAPLDPGFKPAILWRNKYEEYVHEDNNPVECNISLVQTDGTTHTYKTHIIHEKHPHEELNYLYLERLVKFLVWSYGGYKIYLEGPSRNVGKIEQHFKETKTGRFDSQLIGEKVYGHPFEVIKTDFSPTDVERTQPLGRHLEGCRIGFDLGGSDRKVAAVQDGEVVYSAETEWDPYHQKDPQYHLDGILDSLKKAAARLPKVDAIGGSAAGVYINNEVKVSSLFRGISPELFNSRVRNIFQEVKAAMGGVPLTVVNDGEVTALAGSMALGKNSVLGIAMGTSLAAGYVNELGNITTRLNELAFAPIDYNPDAPADEWSGDIGCGVQYFSQQAVGRLLKPAGIELPGTPGLPEQLKAVQELMENGDERAAQIYKTIGVYLGYTLPYYADFYDFEYLLLLGRVTTGKGGDLLLETARQVLDQEFPDFSAKLKFHIPDETEKRHGQAIAAASLPALV
jgi:predicted NBD/HSP70 family sugar kinase